ncbi:MAG: ABC transporter substrate-binding protein [Deltaproteobacteria bacterium]|nr:ABC transporter substrate-binding protein [Deltaproteobacteria bacterium]
MRKQSKNSRFPAAAHSCAVPVTIGLCLLLGFAFLVSPAASGAADDSPVRTQQTITDYAERKVKVPAAVKRIGCLYAFAGHVVAMLGRCPDIVAVANGLRRDVLLVKICPGILSAVVPKAQGAINIEELLNTRPDLLFISPETGRNEAEMQKLEYFKIPSLVVDYKNMQQQQQAIALIGQALGESGRAERYNSYYRKCIDLVAARTQKIPRDKRIKLYHCLTEATHTDAQGSISTDWLRATGIVNVSAAQADSAFTGKAHVGMEQIILWNPDVILANEPGTVETIMGDAQWSSVSAVKNKRVYQMPIGISRWGHPGSLETPLALLWTAKTLYPDSFPDLDITAETRAFYKQFFNYDLSDELLQQMLSGRGMRRDKSKTGR